MNADANSVTISGHSAGCYMTDQMMIVHSESIKGAGLFQCWPFGMLDMTSDIYTTSSEDIAQFSINKIDTAEAAGEIDATSNLANNAVYIFSGTQDHECPPKW